jgi:hypothetical protein
MKGFVQWLLAQRYRPVILAVFLVTVPLVSFVSTALMTFETLRRGGRQGLISAIVATISASVLGWFWGFSFPGFAFAIGATLLAGVGLGMALRQTGTLVSVFQGLLFICLIGASLAGLFWSESLMLMTSIADQGVSWLRSTGASDGQINGIIEEWDRLFIGFMALGIFIQLMAPLLLGSWWASLSGPESKFGHQFRELKLGRFLGVPGTLFMAASLVLDGPIIQNLFPLILFGFWFQGLSVVHAWGKARQWGRGIIAAMYVLLIPPFTGVTIFALASVGLLDNWINLRAQLHGKA